MNNFSTKCFLPKIAGAAIFGGLAGYTLSTVGTEKEDLKAEDRKFTPEHQSKKDETKTTPKW